MTAWQLCAVCLALVLFLLSAFRVGYPWIKVQWGWLGVFVAVASMLVDQLQRQFWRLL